MGALDTLGGTGGQETLWCTRKVGDPTGELWLFGIVELQSGYSWEKEGRYGLLRASDAKRLLDEATSASSEPWWPRWRGRLGVTPEEARQQFADKTSADPALLKTTRKREELPRVPLGDPVPLVFKSWDGEDTYEVNGFEGESLMVSSQFGSACWRTGADFWGRFAGGREAARLAVHPRNVWRPL